ncbi:hypothetical protein [Facklamia sp. P12950]|uniref:hypothetical protein n=1 Tax=unclassified Facklamia TaxID=2622293 RepID=UPI003D180E26
MKLFVVELKRIGRSLIFVGVAIALIIAIIGQIESDSYDFKEPDPGQEQYGHYLTEDRAYIFSNLVNDLYLNIENNHFISYPYGFYRENKLEQDELDAIKDILSDLIGMPYEDIPLSQNLAIPTEEKLETQLGKIDALIGGGSFYAKNNYKIHFGDKGMSYEEAIKDYLLVKEEGLDVAFARYFSDYAGIFTLLFSWFIGLYFWNKDRKEAIENTLYVKNTSSIKLVLTRVLAMSLSLLFIILVLFSYYEIQLLFVHGASLLCPFKSYFFVISWILPIILFVISLTTLLTIASHSILLGFLGPIFSLVYMMSSSTNVFYNIGYGLLIRYNSVGNQAYFDSKVNVFLVGRGIWIGLALFLIIVTSFLYERRRRGDYAFKNNLSIEARVKA